ncbi:hypothetical protein ACF063_07680 [Streptomyces chartreusis]|uniref:hypothetical protein n=1 Tax=Streptomyces TaxID=1883 RepID=UPI001BDDB00B|nr:hypothetical protein [Streptomyces sp. Tu102]MBT1093833.1 hypothetical protein [Streptomyces sp. Tu102]
MDSTDPTRRVLGGDGAPKSYVVPVTGVRGQPSIYAALVAEWRAKGRTVPGRRDMSWDLLVAAAGQGQTGTSWAVGPCSGLTPAIGAGPASYGPARAEERHPATAERDAPESQRGSGEDGRGPRADGQPSPPPERVPAIVVPRGLPGPLFVWENGGGGGRVGVADPLMGG